MYALRLAERADVPALATLLAESVRGLSVGYYDSAVVEAALREMLGVDTQLIDDGTYYVIEAGGTPVACGGWSGRRTLFGGDQFKDAADTRLDPTREPARIRAFFVHPAHARRGLGRRLYEQCAAEAYAAGFRRLELVATLPGEPLYRALGFAAVEEVVVPLAGGLEMRGWRMTRGLNRAR
ncbi:MAG TPA: GNAT family N-acetyltransferase [Gemmatimonadaceae bacterium]|nr:GNAT family N-acetyltransferase [Gemmatimonadaceae bacterium]